MLTSGSGWCGPALWWLHNITLLLRSLWMMIPTLDAQGICLRIMKTKPPLVEPLVWEFGYLKPNDNCVESSVQNPGGYKAKEVTIYTTHVRGDFGTLLYKGISINQPVSWNVCQCTKVFWTLLLFYTWFLFNLQAMRPFLAHIGMSLSVPKNTIGLEISVDCKCCGAEVFIDHMWTDGWCGKGEWINALQVNGSLEMSTWITLNVNLKWSPGRPEISPTSKRRRILLRFIRYSLSV